MGPVMRHPLAPAPSLSPGPGRPGLEQKTLSKSIWHPKPKYCFCRDGEISPPSFPFNVTRCQIIPGKAVVGSRVKSVTSLIRYIGIVLCQMWSVSYYVWHNIKWWGWIWFWCPCRFVNLKDMTSLPTFFCTSCVSMVHTWCLKCLWTFWF